MGNKKSKPEPPKLSASLANLNASSIRKTPFKVICLTGGPCGGKTSSLSILSEYFIAPIINHSLFQNLGWRVYRVPETATVLFSGGVVFSELSPAQQYSFQKDILVTMLSIENSYINLAKLDSEQGRKAVVICDRGAMDPSAYMPRVQWLQLLSELHLDEAALRDHRYDCVVHLVTAAKGAEKFYNLDTNHVRSESLQEAREVDDKVMNAWNGHASLQVIDNAIVSNFAEKCDKVVRAVMTRLGLVNDEDRKNIRKHKFLVKNYSQDIPFPVSFKEFGVEHIYLSNSGDLSVQIRIRKRIETGSAAIHLTMTMRHELDGQMVETRRNLTGREYEALRAQSDPTRHAIQKLRRSFLYNNHYFQMDVFQTPHHGLVLLESYLDSETDADGLKQIKKELLPPWLELEEVTDKKSYSMYELAKKE